MNAFVAGGFLWVAVLAACILLPPLTVLFTGRLYEKTGNRDFVFLRQAVRDFRLLRRESINGSAIALSCNFFYLVFSLTALCISALQMNLLPAVFLQLFGVLAMLAGEIFENRLPQQKIATRVMNEYLVFQPVLIAAAVGFSFATGSFLISDSTQHPRFLLAELPILFCAVLGIAYLAGKENQDALIQQAELCSPVVGDRMNAAVKAMATVYRDGYLLLLAGLLVGYGLAAAAVMAVGLYVFLIWGGPLVLRLLRRKRLEIHWTHWYFAVGLNLIWLYIKYL